MEYEYTPMNAKIESRVSRRRIGSFTSKSSDVITFTFPRPVVVDDHDDDDGDDVDGDVVAVWYDEVYSLILCIEYDDGSGEDDDGDYYDGDDLTDNDE
jgi:hypothetical protein